MIRRAVLVLVAALAAPACTTVKPPFEYPPGSEAGVVLPDVPDGGASDLATPADLTLSSSDGL